MCVCLGVCVRVRVCKFVCMYACVGVCACVREREGEREGGRGREEKGETVFVFERAHACAFVRACARACVYVVRVFFYVSVFLCTRVSAPVGI